MDCEPLLPLAWWFSLQLHLGAEYFSFVGHCVLQPQF